MNEDTSQRELDALSGRLDELADRERATPDDGFESRVLESVRAEVLEPLGRPVLMQTAWWRSSWTLAAAASIAVVITAAMFMWAGAPTPTPNPGPRLTINGETTNEVDEFIETVAWLEDSLPDFSGGSSTGSSTNLDSIDDLYDDLQQTLSVEEESI